MGSKLNLKDINMYDNSKYNKDKVNDIKYSLKYEEKIEYMQSEKFLVINSKDRNVTDYPNSNHFCIFFDDTFKNISKIELIQAIIPDKNSVTSEPYLLLNIDEISETMYANDKYISDSFAVLQLCKPITTGGFINIEKRIHENVVKYYNTPKSSLSKMTIKIMTTSGSLFDFGGSGDLSKEYQVVLVFRITCIDKSTSEIKQRNVY